MGVPALLNIPELRETVGVTFWGFQAGIKSLLKTGNQAR